MTDRESFRLAEQSRLDRLRTGAERNRLGQFATPPTLADEIAEAVRRLWGDRGPVRFLDPSLGTGSFYSALQRTFPAALLGEGEAVGVEVDPRFAAAAREVWGGSGLEVREGDFTRMPPPAPPSRAANLILANPPYVRHHHLSAEDKARLRGRVAEALGLEISGLAGLHCHFLLLADAWLAGDGLAAWLIPSEFMEVNYGEVLRRYLTERVTLRRIHRAAPADVQFGDALVTTAVLIFEKGPPPPGHRVEVSVGGSLLAPARLDRVRVEALRGSRKWTGDLGEAGERGTAPGVRLGDLFAIKRGIATGSNRFFILPRDEARSRGIPEAFLKPILPGARALSGPVIEAGPDPAGYPALPRPLALIDCDLPEETLRREHPAFWSYLESGLRDGVHQGYLASRRRPWYAQERRPPAPFLCTYMGRTGPRPGLGPFRFFWNRSRAVAANVFLLLYPRDALADALGREPSLYPEVLASLQAIRGEDLIGEGRVYGGGLHKVEPRELARLPAGALADLPGCAGTGI